VSIFTKRFVVGFAGKNRSGKSTAVDYFEKRHSAYVAGFGYPLRAIAAAALSGETMGKVRLVAARELFLPTDRDALDRLEKVLRSVLDRDLSGIDTDNRMLLQELSTALRSPSGFGEEVLARAIYEKIRLNKPGLYAVDSVRREADISYLRHFQHFHLCYIHAGVRVRRRRDQDAARGSGDAEKTLAQFLREDRQESERQIKALRALADSEIHNHAGVTKEAFFAKLDALREHMS